MKVILLLNIILISLSCANISDKKSDKNNLITDTSSTPINIEKVKTDTVIFSAEDSLKFYSACEEEKKLIDQFCECAQKNGRDHVDCRTFIKQKNKYVKIEDEIINKYYIGEFSNPAISEKLSKKTRELINLFNKCK
jgi:hypothetical protein